MILPVNEVILRMKESLEVNRKHQALYEWKDLMRKIDLIMSHPDMARVFCTDFGATLDLGAGEKDNSLVNNHAVIGIFLVNHSWRLVKFKKKKKGPDGEEIEVEDETIISDCDKFIFFGDTRSKGKKMIMYSMMHV